MQRDRYLTAQVESDLPRKMVFLGGPRQCGKTTLAKKLLAGRSGYLNWDADDDRERILARQLPDSDLWVFDEIHKFRRWRNYLKGLFDKREPGQQILVTGSARLDLYRFGGDSLQGRYHFLRLHPMSLAEMAARPGASDLEDLFHLGGFPEPLFGSSKKEANRWSLEYRRRLVREEVASLERFGDLASLELVVRALPERVGSPLSINGLREDVQVAHKTMSKWLDALERVYSIYRLAPFGPPRIKAVKKEQKHYHFDWNLISDEGARFENLVAGHLLKWCQFIEDTEGREVELRYFREVTGQEVDFVVVEGRKPILLVEAKLGDAPIQPALLKLKSHYPDVPAWQIHLRGKKDYRSPEGIRVCSALKLLETLV